MTSVKFVGECELVDRYPYDSTPRPLPVALTDVRQHIQIEHELDDTIVRDYIMQAAEQAENMGQVSLINQKRRLVLNQNDVQQYDFIALPMGPVQSVLSVTYLDADEEEQEFSDANYRFVARGTYRGLWFKSVPVTADGPGVLWIDYEAGYGSGPNSIPYAWQSVVWALAARKYDYRHIMGGGMDEAFEKMMRNLVAQAGGSFRYA